MFQVFRNIASVAKTDDCLVVVQKEKSSKYKKEMNKKLIVIEAPCKLLGYLILI